MKSSLFAALALVGAAAPAFAAKLANKTEEKTFKVKAQVRLDHRVIQADTDGTKKSSGGFTLNRARLAFEGSADKDLSYRFKLDLDRNHVSDAGSIGANDGVSRGLKEAKVAYAFAKNFSLEFGRLEVNTMSVEGFYSSMDLYSVSEQLIRRKPGSANGVALVADYEGQQLTLQAVNSPGYDTTGTYAYSATEDDDMTLTLYYRGNFGGGLIQPIISAANISRHDYDAKTQTKSSRYDAQIYGIGTSVVADELTVELEGDFYRNGAYRKNNAVDIKTGKASVDTAIASVRYQIKPANVTAILKTSQDQEKYNDDVKKDKVATTKYNVVAEWRPFPQNIRFHASYENAVSRTTKEGKDDSKTKTNTYIVGTAASI